MTQPTPTAASEPSQSKRAFLSHMRHELRTPLNAIIGYSEMLLEEAADTGDNHLVPDLDRVHRGGKRLLAIVNEILDAAKIESVDEADLDLAIFGRNLDRELRSPLNTVIGYSEMLMEEAADTEQEEVINEVNRIHIASKRLLAIVDEAVRSSKAEPTESEDYSVVPDVARTVQETVMPERPEVPPGEEIPAEGRILVVDDIETNRDLLGRRLGKQGFTISVAEDGLRALAMLRAQPFDLVLLDIMMPGLNGYQVLQQMKDDEALRHIPVIMISALDEVDSVVRCIEIGAEDYLSKPFNPVLLNARIGASLEKKRLRDREVSLYLQLQENFQRLKELEELRDSLIGMVVHDLRTPLTSLLAGIQSMPILGPLNDKQEQFLNISVRGGETLLSMINDLLDISKMEDGSLKLEYTDSYLPEFIQYTVQQVHELIVAENQNLSFEVAPDVPMLHADEEKIRRTLINLLGNAIKFTPRGGAITIKVALTASRDAFQFAIIDTGEGIPQDSFERIFDKFGQVEGRTSGRKMSTGLGLTFCKMVVEAHGGRIWVESELRKGSTFFFTIPSTPPSA